MHIRRARAVGAARARARALRAVLLPRLDVGLDVVDVLALLGDEEREVLKISTSCTRLIWRSPARSRMI